jgi:hypothetical protein
MKQSDDKKANFVKFYKPLINSLLRHEPKLSVLQYKIILLIAKLTWGYHRDKVNMSYKDIAKGVCHR